MVDMELTEKVITLKQMKMEAEELADQIAAVETEIKGELQARGVDELRAGPFKVRWTAVTSYRFDTSKFKVIHAALYDQFSRPIETRRFSIV